MRYVGIDIGDGESAICVVSESGSLLPTPIYLGSVKSIRSMVGTLQGKPVIGDQNLLNHAITDKSTRFKSRFLTESSSHEDLRRFATGLYELFRQSIPDEEVEVALGCPSQWTAGDRQQYAAIVMSAGFPNLHTVSESRAAFLYAHYCNELNLSAEQMARPTLVIDIGSSTLDYAYIVDGKEQNIGIFGETYLGGGLLDALILDHAIQQAPNSTQIRTVLDANPSWRSYCEMIARKLKEEYFSHEASYTTTACNSVAPIYADPSHPLSLTISLSGQTMKDLLDQPIEQLGKSFRQALSDSLQQAKKITAEHPVELLIVTGGASRMQFFQDMCREVFPDAFWGLCEEPEFSIASGLAIAARTDKQLAAFRSKIAAFFESGTIEKEVNANIPHLLPHYIPILAAILDKKAIAQGVLNFQGDLTNANQFQQYMMDLMDDVLTNQLQTKEANDVVNQWIATHLTTVQESLNAICDEYHIDRADMSLVDIHTNVQIPQLKFPLSVRLLTGLVKIKLFRDLLRGAIGHGVMKQQIRRQLHQQLNDPASPFSQTLCQQLVQQLQMQIDERTKKVEIQIS